MSTTTHTRIVCNAQTGQSYTETYETVDPTPEEIEAQRIADYKASVPKSISMRQCRLVLLAHGMLTQVNQAVTTMSEAAQIEWEYASEVARTNLLVAGISALLSLSEDDMDALFLEAGEL